MYVPLVIQLAKRMRRIILLSVACLYLQYFSTLARKRHDFLKKKKLSNIKCVFWFSLQFVSEICFILRRFQRDVTINIQTSSCKESVTWSDFNEAWISWTDFLKKLKYQMSLKSVYWEPSCAMLRDKHDETSSGLSLFCEISCEDSQLNEKQYFA